MDAAHSVAAVDSGRESSPEGETVWRQRLEIVSRQVFCGCGGTGN